jgi:hypothetical protein
MPSHLSDFASIKQPSPHNDMLSHSDVSHHPMMGQVTTEMADAAAAGEKQGSRGSTRLEPHDMFFIYFFVYNLN